MTVVAFAQPERVRSSPPAPEANPAEASAVPLSYLAHFGLAEAPFGLTPDTDYFYASPPHQEALNTLLYALQNGEGFIRIVGAVGTGKTLLCRTLLASLPPQCHALYLPNPAIEPAGILHAVADELGLELAPGDNLYRVHKALHARLIELARCGIRAVLVIDEAQAMSRQCLEAVRLLSNLETEKRKLLAIVLLGQPELDAQLDAIPQFKTRISFHDNLRPLTRAELDAYIAHRLQRAGHDARWGMPFSAGALGMLHAASGGVPRVANILAHKALLLAYGKGRASAGRREMRAAARDTLAAQAPRRGRLWLLLLVAVLAGAAGVAAWHFGLVAHGPGRLAGLAA
ncbi:MAG: ExeA family protein [Gammaproteobacteria bacterium]